MKLLNLKKINLIFVFIFLSLIILKFFNTPFNFYSILNWNYKDRMDQNYGFCKNESWGFQNYVINKFDLKNLPILSLCNQYIAFIVDLKQVSIEIASERIARISKSILSAAKP